MRSTEQRARRAEKERERRAAESPACRQSRLASVKAATRRRRQALTLESDITAKRRNSEKKRERRAASVRALFRLANEEARERICVDAVRGIGPLRMIRREVNGPAVTAGLGANANGVQRL